MLGGVWGIYNQAFCPSFLSTAGLVLLTQLFVKPRCGAEQKTLFWLWEQINPRTQHGPCKELREHRRRGSAGMAARGGRKKDMNCSGLILLLTTFYYKTIT